jgi:hypothetical protein
MPLLELEGLPYRAAFIGEDRAEVLRHIQNNFADRQPCVFVSDDESRSFWSKTYEQVIGFDDDGRREIRCNLVVVDSDYTYCPRIQIMLRSRVPVLIVNKAECVARALMNIAPRDEGTP